MAASIVIRRASAHDARYIGDRLRQSDAREVALLAPECTAAEAVEATRAFSIFSRTAEVDGTPAVIFGVTPSAERLGWGKPWMVGTDALERISRRFVLGCREHVEDMQREFACLHNIVHRENQRSVAWLRWLGFTVGSVPCGPQEEFFMFWRKHHVR